MGGVAIKPQADMLWAEIFLSEMFTAYSIYAINI